MPQHHRTWIGVALLALLPLVPRTPGAAGPVVRETLRFEAGSIAVVPVEGGARIDMKGLGSETAPGRDRLPLLRLTREAPEGMKLVACRASVAGWERMDVGGPIASLPTSRPPEPGMTESPAMGETRSFGVAEMAGGGFLRGRRLDTVVVRPVRRAAAQGAIEVAREVSLELVYGPDEATPVRSRRGEWDSQSSFRRAADRLTGRTTSRDLDSRDRLVPLVNGEVPFSPRFNPSEDGSPVRLLIITEDALADAFQELADWKTSIGMPAVVRTLSWIHANYPVGHDEAEDVRNFIREAMVRWGVEYVLIGGDVDIIPIRYAKSYFYGGEDIPTDLYYACLDGNWNADGDALFGEAYINGVFTGDAADFYPDVWVGRAPVRSAAEAERFVQKVRTYEAQAPLGAGFGDRVLAFAEVFFPQNWSPGDSVFFDGALLAEDAYAIAGGTTAFTRLYENHTKYPGSLPESKTSVVAAINSGYNLMLHVGHGYRNTMTVGLGGGALTNGDADLFYNGSRQGILYAINCTSSALDFDCIAEHFLRNPFGGVLGTIGSTRIDFPATGWDYQNEFFTLVHQMGVTTVGEAAALQKVPFVPDAVFEGEHRWTQLSMIYLGDPSLDLYTGPVGELTVTVDEPFELGRSLYTVRVSDGSGPVGGATVCLDKPGDAYGVAVTDAAGTALVTFEPDSAGVATLGARAHNRRSRVSSVTVAPPAGPHLFVADITVDDATGGDGDGALEAGESAYLYPTVANEGGSGASSVVLTLTGVPGVITVTDAVASIGSVSAGASAASVDPFAVTVSVTAADAGAPTGSVLISAAGYSRAEDLVLYVGAPEIDLYALALRDTVGNGNGNGNFEANEEHHLRLHVWNRGLGRSRALTAALSSTDPAVTILDGSSSYGDLERGATAGGDGFRLKYSDTNTARLLTVTFSDQRGAFAVRKIDLGRPAVPTALLAKGGGDAVTLQWTKPADADLRGYSVFRALATAGPYTRLLIAPTDNSAYYRDENLPPLTRYYYKVAAVDSSGNEGVLSGVISATTSLPAHDGFPLSTGTSTSSAPCLAFVGGDAKAEIVTGGNEIHLVHDDGTEWIDGDRNAQTFGVFSGTGFGPFWSPPAVGDLDGDGVPEIVSCGWSTGYLYVWGSHGGVRPGFPRNLNITSAINIRCWGGAALGDVDGDGRMEIFINAGQYLFGFNDDGTEVVDGDANPATLGVFQVMGASANYSTPAIADVDNDGAPEVIVGSRDGKLYVKNGDGTNLPGFPWASGGDITNSPAVGDLNNDGLKEIVFGNGNLQVHAINVNLVQPPGWPAAANMNRDFDASPALADLNGDGYLDVIVCAGNGTVYAFKGQNGQMFPGWGFVIYDAAGQKVGLSSSPAVGNLDADPQLEVCFGANDRNLYAYNLDGTLVAGFPIGTENSIEGGPLLWDIDQDGLTEVVVHSYDEKLYVWDSPGPFDPNNQPWPMFHQNSRRTGEAYAEPWVALSAPDAGIDPVPVLAPNLPNPFASRTAIRFAVPGSAGAPVRLDVFDVRGRLVRTLVDGLRAPGEHEELFDARDEAGQRLAGGVYFYRLVVAGNSHTRKMVLLP